jgi:hypothetical protein
MNGNPNHLLKLAREARMSCYWRKFTVITSHAAGVNMENG